MVSLCIRRITPTASAQAAAIASSTPRSISAMASSATSSAGADVELDFRRAAPVHRRIVAGGDARRRLVDQEQRDALAVPLPARGARADQQVGGPGRGVDHRLAPVERPALAAALGRRRHVVEVEAALRLGLGEGEDRLAGPDARSQSLARSQPEFFSSAPASTTLLQIGLDEDAPPSCSIITMFSTGPPPRPPASSGREAPSTPSSVASACQTSGRQPLGRVHRRLPRLETVVVAQVTADQVAQHPLLFGEAEIHLRAPGPSWR